MSLIYKGKTIADVGGGSSEEIYSTEEQRIGTWIDGKPLYRRVFEAPIADASGTWNILNVFTESVSGIFFNAWSINPSNGDIEPLPTTAGSGTSLAPTKVAFEPGAGIKAYNVGAWYVGRTVRSVLKYTKNTDEATS